MSSIDAQRYLGEYHLKKIVFETTHIRRWLAQQLVVSRDVWVDELKDEHIDQRDVFLADVRAKAAIDFPLIASVYEAISEAGHCYYAHEILAGVSLQDGMLATEPYAPSVLVHWLKRLAEVNLQLENQGHSTAALGLNHLFVDAQEFIRIENLVVSGPRAADESERDIRYLGKMFSRLVAKSKSGSNRLLTLLNWMQGIGIEKPITWEQVIQLCDQINGQLDSSLPSGHTSNSKKNPKLIKASIAAILGLSVTLVLGFLMRPPLKQNSKLRVELPNPIRISNGVTHAADGMIITVPEFVILAHEVTIGEYAKFLQTLDSLAVDQRERIFDHTEQPAEKASHRPNDWEALYSAAKSNKLWNGYVATLDSPIVGVDWWDCSAYAEWKHGRLPSPEEWSAALGNDSSKASAMTAGAWQALDLNTSDRTPTGVLNMAGSVSEWTGRPAVNPANPLGEKQWVLMGGSYLRSNSSAHSKEWIQDRSLRRQDLGFRIVLDQVK